MQLSTVFATVAVAATAVSAAVIPQEARSQMIRRDGGIKDIFTDGQLTWYAGQSLAAPSCGGAAPGDNDLAIAVSANSGFPCGSWLHIHANGKMIPAKVVDTCESCSPHHVDATKGVFSALDDLDVGLLHDVHLVSFWF